LTGPGKFSPIKSAGSMEKPGMEAAVAPAPRVAGVSALVDFARRAPGKVLAGVLGAHLVVWTLLPILVSRNLQLDLVEDLALGREWQLGYWKHPPLPWWIAELVYRLTGETDSVYVLGPLAAVICLYGVWLLARELVGGLQALIAVLVLEGVHFYNFSAVKFAHDQAQLPFWAFTALVFHRAVTRGGIGSWALAGALLAGAFWAKYAAFALAATLGLVLLLDPQARRAWRTAGPYVMALVFAAVIAPNVWWLVHHDLMPFRYVDARAKTATEWYQYLLYPVQWTGSQIFFLLPGLGLLAVLYAGGRRHADAAAPASEFDRRYVAALALGPFAFTTLIAAVLGRLPVAMWGYPLWSFAPLALIMRLGPVADPARLRRFAKMAIAVLVVFPLAYAGVELLEPIVRDRPKASQFPGAEAASEITRRWHETFGTPLAYVGGAEFATNNVAVYSSDRPHVVVHGDPSLSPWIDIDDLHRRGAVLVWEDDIPAATLEQWRATFGPFDLQPALVLPRLTLHSVRPARIGYALVPPRP
jgi:Dolichyl-phosphate-mannose-protein mannosyltransferase